LLILTVNLGSSNIKAALYRAGMPGRGTGSDGEQASPEIIDSFESQALTANSAAAGSSHLLEQGAGDVPSAPIFHWLGERRPDVVGHRVVHGGQSYREPQLITSDVLTTLRRLIPLDPTHMPQAIAAIEATSQALPSAAQIACFDTTFHRQMSKVAQLYALPRDLSEAGIIRYGFHGLSCEFIMSKLGSLSPVEARGRVIIAHLGNGSSMTAVRDGVGVDTTMGLTPTGGLVMGTRCGDLDPGVLVYMVESRRAEPGALSRLVNHQAGLLAVSGTSADMRELLGREKNDYRAREAIELYCYQARKFLGALTTTLGGLDTLVFTGGIGENAPAIRRRICSDLDFLGVTVDEKLNTQHAPVISKSDDAVTVRVMNTDEDLVIARHAYRLVSQGGEPNVLI
jgi:acetate kinase